MTADEIELVRSSATFDVDWYLQQYPDVRLLSIDAAEHYLTFGARLGRDPSPLFNSNYYLRRYPDVERSGMNPLLHYLRIGGNECRSPIPKAIMETDEPQARFVALNEILIDWPLLRRDLDKRNADLVSIVICVYCNGELTRKCLEAIAKNTAQHNYEIVLVNNGSDDGTTESLVLAAKDNPRVTLVDNGENLNFALGNNIGFKYSQGSRIIFLNNDAEVGVRWLNNLMNGLAEDNTLAVQPKLLYPDGRVQGVGVVFSERGVVGYPIYTGEGGDAKHVNISRSYQAISAACLGIRAKDFASVNGFDPTYINGQEDIDLCLRLGRGKPLFRYVPDSVVIHHESKSPGRRKYIPENRRHFVKRWASMVVPDDASYYALDGKIAEVYSSDFVGNQQEGIAQWRPIKFRHVTGR